MMEGTAGGATVVRAGDEERRLAEVRRFEVVDTPAEPQFDRLTRIAALVCATPAATITIVDADRTWLKAKVGIGLAEIDRSSGLCDVVLASRRPVAVPDALADPRTCANALVTGDFGLRAYLGVPLRTVQDEAVGTLCVMDRVAREFTQTHVAFLQELAEVVVHELELRLAVQRVGAESRLRRIAESQRARAERDARTDVLTGLWNRRALEFDLDVLERTSFAPEGVVVLVDIDDLKTVNDQGGHAAGDRYLRDFADELRAYFRDTDGIYRVGGDEFALVVRCGGLDPRSVRGRLEWVVDRLRRAYPGAGASVGVAEFSTAAGTPRGALEAADVRMYQEKRRKRLRPGSLTVPE